MTPWTVACQASLSMRFSKREYWSRWPFPAPADRRNPGIKPASPALAHGFFTAEPPGKPREDLREGGKKVVGCQGSNMVLHSVPFPGIGVTRKEEKGHFFHSPLQLPYRYLPKSECNCYTKSCFLNGHLGEGVEKREPSYITGGNVNLCSHYGKQYGGSLKKLKIELPNDPAIPLLGI